MLETKNFSAETLGKFSLVPSLVGSENYNLNLDILAYWGIAVDVAKQNAIVALEPTELPIALASCDEDRTDYFQYGKNRNRIDKTILTEFNNSSASQTNLLPIYNVLDKLYSDKIELASTVNDARNNRNVEAKEFLKKFKDENQNEAKEQRTFALGGKLTSTTGFELNLSYILSQGELVKSYSDGDIVVAAALYNYGKQLTPEQIDQFVKGVENKGLDFGNENKLGKAA